MLEIRAAWLGIQIAISMGMTGLRRSTASATQRVQWQHLLFVKGMLTISCDIEKRGDGTYAATLFPLWAPEERVTEIFGRAQEATHWHAEMAQRLQLAGWLRQGGAAVTTAA